MSKRTKTRVPAHAWERRVYRNSYTRAGKSHRVKHWSVKIQFQGKRQTLSLDASTRGGAAAEASRLHERIIRRGWESVSKASQRGRRRPARTADEHATTAYWRSRLLQRSYPKPDRNGIPQWSIRIEYGGMAACFPLQTHDGEEGARRARSVWHDLQRDGWPAVLARHSREITLTVYWMQNPLAWTYTTLHTIAGSSRLMSPYTGQPIIIVEPDATLSRALKVALETNRESQCQCCYTMEDALEIQPMPGAIWLANRDIPSVADRTLERNLQTMGSDQILLTYGLYEDSVQVFVATPGGLTAYYLKRTTPERLLEPLGSAAVEAITEEEVLQRVRDYFRGFLAPSASVTSDSEDAHLTPREQEILELLSKGFIDKEIAARLGISTWTVHGHVKKVFEKLGVHTRTEAAVKFLRK